MFAHENQLRARWPAFHDLLVTHTPFRSVVALALPGQLRGHGALDLYLTHPVGLVTFDAMEALCVAELISDELGHAATWTQWTEFEGPPWTNSEPARQRARVWMATGMVSLVLKLQTADALAVLRSYAYAADRTVDALATTSSPAGSAPRSWVPTPPATAERTPQAGGTLTLRHGTGQGDEDGHRAPMRG
jgi:hypothetical protein